jgi:hypothetical protein
MTVVSRPANPVVVAAAAGKFMPASLRSKITRPIHELPMRAAFTVPEFCWAHGISRSKYYEMKKEGCGPVEMHVGRRRLISNEAATAWRREREVETAASSTAAE